MTPEKDILTRIQNWYQTNCNGDWEHSYGFSIGTLDNPGWTIKIDLADTALENLQFEREIDNGRFDWLIIQTKRKVFEVHGDPTKLTEVLKIFLDEIIPNYADKDFHYEVYIPLKGSPVNAWRPINAKMLTEEILEIVDIPALTYKDIKTKTIDEITFLGKEDTLNYEITYSVGDKIKTELAEMFDGVALIVREE